MYQKLEEYIKEHREHLDVETPSENVWNHVQKDLDKKTLSLWERFPLLKIAAAVIAICMLAGLAWGLQDNMPQNVEVTAADLPSVELPSSLADWRKAEKQYQIEIQSLLKEIQAHSIEDDDKALEILLQVGMINDQLSNLKGKMIPLNYDSEKAREMLALYQSKIDHLKDLRDHLNDK